MKEYDFVQQTFTVTHKFSTFSFPLNGYSGGGSNCPGFTSSSPTSIEERENLSENNFSEAETAKQT